MKNYNIYKILVYLLILTLGVFLGWLLFHESPIGNENHNHDENKTDQVWTCSMHPQIRMDKQGKCPLCAMDLIPVTQISKGYNDNAVHLTPEAVALANISTWKIQKQEAEKEVRLYGKIQADERKIKNQVSHISGRIEKLLVGFTGDRVNKGQVLAEIYSPELITAQQELLETYKIKEHQPLLFEAAKEKLLNWRLTENQVQAILTSGNIIRNTELVSEISGIVINKRVNTGDYITSGSVLYDIADLSNVWAMFDAYESDLPFINEGNVISFTLEALPGKTFSGNIQYIDPVIDPNTRIARVRVEVDNRHGRLKPEMFINGILKSNLREFRDKLVIPGSAVLWTGKRSVVYIKHTDKSEPVFSMREITLGPSLGKMYIVQDGLKEGEEIVVHGAFNIDAAAQLEGKVSMMNLENTDEQAHTLKVATIKVSGSCEMCKERIEMAALSVKGVKFANWDMDTHLLEIKTIENTQISAVHKAVAKEGHDTDIEKAPIDIYKTLPECCLYRN